MKRGGASKLQAENLIYKIISNEKSIQLIGISLKLISNGSTNQSMSG